MNKIKVSPLGTINSDATNGLLPLHFGHELMMRSSADEPNHRVLEWLLVTLTFLLFAAQIPPEVNEPNYLAKARHYWNPAWCPNDFFLNSADAHAPFYFAFGWPLLYIPMGTFAWVGRTLASGLLAFGWVQLTSSLTRRSGVALVGAAIMLGLNTFFQSAGEWVAGGFEGKGIAYAFIFWALGEIMKNRWNRGWILLGIASIFHVVVGGWACVAATIGWFLLGRHSDRPTFRSQIGAIAAGFAISCLGLVPGLQLRGQATVEATIDAAHIQVFTRLPHHLNPAQFFFRTTFPFLTPPAIWFLGLCLIWILMARRQKDILTLRRLDSFTAGVLAIAFIGLCISLATQNRPTLAARLLQFYWFRLADVIVPVAVALAAAYHLSREQRLKCPPVRVAILVAILGILLWPVVQLYQAGGVPPADRKFTTGPRQFDDWQAVCRAAREVSPPEAVFLTPKYAHTFKWYADRGEVGTWKEMPQDAPSIVKWHDRLNKMHLWGPLGMVPLSERSVDDLQMLGKAYGANFILTRSTPPLALPLLYRNDSFALYRLF